MNTKRPGPAYNGLPLLLFAAFYPYSASADESSYFYEIEAQSMDRALKEFAAQTEIQVAFSPDTVEGLTARAVEGNYAPESALQILIDESDLDYEFASEKLIVVRALPVVASERADSAARSPARASVLMLGAATPTGGNDSVGAAVERAASSDEGRGSAEDDMEEIIVTGSQLITDPGKMTRQVTVFNRAEIERSGVTRLDEFLRRLPQNMNAPGNVGTGIPGPGLEFGLGDNVFAGSTINLRGLGSQYTLILINGRRPARGGQFGDVTDISNIPIERIERIEVLFDGAAAIYGADAVGGVVNIITRQDYDGTDLSLTYSDTEDGGGARYNLQIGHTFNWGSGSLTATASYQTQEQIEGNQRSGAQLTQSTADVLGGFFVPPSANGNVRAQLRNFDLTAPEYRALFWVNGNDRLSGGVEVPAAQQVWNGTGFEFVETTAFVDRQTGQLPPGYFWIDEAADRPQNPEALGFTPVFQADLPQYSGQRLGIGEVATSNELGESVYVPFDGLALSPEDDTYNIGLSFAQDLTEDIRLTLNADYIATSKVSFNEERARSALIPADAPGNPFGQSFNYSYQDRFPQQYQDIESTVYNVSGGIDWDLSQSWSLALGFGYSEQEQDAQTINNLRTDGLGPDTIEARLSGYYDTRVGGTVPPVFVREFTGSNFNDPFLGYDSFEAMIAALVVPLQRTYNHSTQYEADLRLLGKLFELPAGDVRTSLSLRYREDESEAFTSDSTLRFTSNALLDLVPLEGRPGFGYDDRFGESVKTLAAEVSVPVFGADFDLPLVDSFLLSFAGSLEEYSNTDEDGFNWSAGFNWGVNEQFIVRLNRTFNLRVPESVRTAREPRWNFSPSYSVYADASDLVPTIPVNQALWTIDGGANHLRPESNYGTALSFIYRPAFAEGLDIQVNLSQSRTVDQLGNPFMGRWTLDTVLPESLRANPLFAFGDPASNPFHASAAAVFGGDVIRMAPGDLIFDGREYNIGDTFNRGADFQISYNLATRFGDWLLTWRHQYLDTNEVTRSNLCDQVEQGCVVDDVSSPLGGLDEPIDTVGSVSRESFAYGVVALPRNQGSIDLFWGYRGLGVNLSTQYTATTSVYRTADISEAVIIGYIEFNGQRIPITDWRFVGTNIYREDSRPEQTVHLSLSYDFARGSLFDAPRWLGDARISLTVDNLYRISERKQSTTVVQNEVDQPFDQFEEVNRFTVFPRGRSYALRFSTTF